MKRIILIALGAVPSIFVLSAAVAREGSPPPGYPPGWTVRSEHLPPVMSMPYEH